MRVVIPKKHFIYIIYSRESLNQWQYNFIKNIFKTTYIEHAYWYRFNLNEWLGFKVIKLDLLLLRWKLQPVGINQIVYGPGLYFNGLVPWIYPWFPWWYLLLKTMGCNAIEVYQWLPGRVCTSCYNRAV